MKTLDFRIIATEAHASVNQTYDGLPYDVHLQMVNQELQSVICLLPEDVREDVIAAGWYHDMIEDCRYTYNDIVKISNVRVAEIVYALSNEKGKNREERANSKYYEGIRNTPYARLIKLCDRLANIKYSYSQKSRMFEVYQNEHVNFIKKNYTTKIYVKNMKT